MSDTATHTQRHAAGPIGRVRADLINFFAATAMVGTFSLGFPQSMWFFFAVAGLTIITVIIYWVIKLWMKYKKDIDIKENEARISANLALIIFLVAVTCGAFTFIGEVNKTGELEHNTSVVWLVFNIDIAGLVLMQIIFHVKRENLKKILTWLVLMLLTVLCVATIASASLSAASLNRAANIVVIAGLVCWLVLEALGLRDNLRHKKNTQEYAGIKLYWIKNVLQILAAISFITFLGLLLSNLNDDDLGKNTFVNAGDQAQAGIIFFYIACGTTILGVIAGVYCGFRHFINKLPADNDVDQSWQVREDDDEHQERRPPQTRRRDALKRTSREIPDTTGILVVKQ